MSSSELSPRQRQTVEAELTQFAHQQNPLFARGLRTRMAMTLSDSFVDNWSYAIQKRTDKQTELDPIDSTTINLYFEAEHYEGGYAFKTGLSMEQAIEPLQLPLDKIDWDAVAFYCDLEDGAITSSQEAADALASSAIDCAHVLHSRHSYETTTGRLRSNQSHLYLIDGDTHHDITTHSLYYDQEIITQLSPRGLSKTDYEAFTHIIKPLAQDLHENGNLMPADDKVRELLYVVQCLKKHTIALNGERY